jgi:aerobic-type carbon monoxide dehydrogenase small subunit (CoxS/CutS family)
MSEPVRFTLNDRPVTLDTDPTRTLLWVLRTDLELTGTKYGCGVGQCGSCTVVIDGGAVRSCQARLGDVAGKHVTTIEGLARDGTLDPLQEAFAEHGGFQCGYCTSGMIMSAHAMLHATPRPSTARIVEGLEGNLCRCGAHQRIVEAVASVARGPVGGDHE